MTAHTGVSLLTARLVVFRNQLNEGFALLDHAEVVARLFDGRIARLLDARQFLGWRGYDANPSMLFTAKGRQIVVGNAAEKYIARDGSLLYADREVIAA